MAAIIVEQTYSHSNTDTRLVREVAEDMLLLEPDQTPLLVLTTKNNRKLPADQPKFEWFEKAEVSVWDIVASTTDYSTTTTTILVTDITLYQVGDILLFPQAPTSSAMEELALVGTVGTNNVVVTRGFAGTTAAAIGSTQSIRIMGGALVEGSAVAPVRNQAAVAKASYCAIFKGTVDISGTMESTKAYAAPEGKRVELQMEALARHKQEIEAAGLWSAGTASIAVGGSTWSTQGVKPTIVTNVTDAATTFTLLKFNDFCETAFRYGASEKLLMAAPKVISALNYFSAKNLLTNVGDTKFGVKISRLFGNGLGEFILANNFRMGDGVAGKNGFTDEAYSIDLPAVSYRYLAGNNKSRDTKLFLDEAKDGKDRTVDQYLSQVGWQIRHEKRHARLFNVQGYS
jgi:hypothetical protein